jgi:hypothetical protein
MLKHADNELKDDEEIIRYAMNICPCAYEYASIRLQNKKEIIDLYNSLYTKNYLI